MYSLKGIGTGVKPHNSSSTLIHKKSVYVFSW